MGGRSGKVCLTWDLQVYDRKEFDYAHSFQPPYHHLSLEILLVAPQAQHLREERAGMEADSVLGVSIPHPSCPPLFPITYHCSSQWSWPQAKAIFPPFHSPHPQHSLLQEGIDLGVIWTPTAQGGIALEVEAPRKNEFLPQSQVCSLCSPASLGCTRPPCSPCPALQKASCSPGQHPHRAGPNKTHHSAAAQAPCRDELREGRRDRVSLEGDKMQRECTHG